MRHQALVIVLHVLRVLPATPAPATGAGVAGHVEGWGVVGEGAAPLAVATSLALQETPLTLALSLTLSRSDPLD